VRVCVQINNLLSQPLILHSQTASKIFPPSCKFSQIMI